MTTTKTVQKPQIKPGAARATKKKTPQVKRVPLVGRTQKTRNKVRRNLSNKRSQVISVPASDGSVSIVTKTELAYLSKTQNKPPEHFVFVTAPAEVILPDDPLKNGIQCNWSAIFEAVIIAQIAGAPSVDIPLGPAALKAYYWWAMISFLRDHNLLANPPNPSVVPDFSPSYSLPTGVLKFFEYLLPYHDPSTGTDYQYQVDYLLFNAGAIPASANTSMIPGGTGFSQSVFGDSMLNHRSYVKSNPPSSTNYQEELFFLDTGGFLLNTGANSVVANALKFSKYVSEMQVYGTLSNLPKTAPDGSMFVFVAGPSTPNPGLFFQLCLLGCGNGISFPCPFHYSTSPSVVCL